MSVLPPFDPSAVAGMKEPVYRVQFNASSCAFKAFVNGCPVFESSGRNEVDFPATVNGWLNARTSALRVEITPVAGLDRLDPNFATFKARITASDMTQPIEGRQEALLGEVQLDMDKEKDEPYPIVLEQEFDVPTRFPEWTWGTAPRLDTDTNLERDANALIQQLWTTLQNADVRGVVGMQVVKTREMSAAMFQRTDERDADVASDIERLVKDPDARLEPLDPDGVRFSLFADNRIARVENAEGKPVIRFRFAQSRLVGRIPVFVTRDRRGSLVWIR